MGGVGVVGVAAAIAIAPKTARHLRLNLNLNLKPYAPFAFLSLYAPPNPKTTTLPAPLSIPLFRRRLSLHSPPFSSSSSSSRRSFCAATLHSGEATAAHQKVGEFRRKLKVVDVKGGPDQGLDKLGHNLVLMGWVRTLRLQSSVTFVEVSPSFRFLSLYFLFFFFFF